MIKTFFKEIATRIIVLFSPILLPLSAVLDLIYNLLCDIFKDFKTFLVLIIESCTWSTIKSEIKTYFILVPIALFNWKKGAIQNYWDKKYEIAKKKQEEHTFGHVLKREESEEDNEKEN